MLSKLFNATHKPVSTEDIPHRQLPAGQIETADEQFLPASPDLVALAVDGWKIKQRIDALQKELKGITTKLENSLGAGTSLAIDEVCRVTISERTTFTLTDPLRCRELLGGRFEDLVQSTVEYTLSDKLKDMARDADHPLSDGLRSCIAVKSGVSVAFRPGKAL